MNNLSEIRRKLDELDVSITGLLEERLDLVLKAAQIKDTIEDTDRESEILKRISDRFSNQEKAGFLKAIYNAIFSEGKKIMSNTKNR